MPDPITSFSQIQKSFAQLQRAQGALSNGDTQEALKSMQDMLNNNGTSSNLANNPNLQGLLSDPKVQDMLGSLQKGLNSPGGMNNPTAGVQGVAPAQDASAAGNRTLTEDTALSSPSAMNLGLSPLSGGSVAPAFGEVIQGFVQNVSASQEKSAEMIESFSLGEEVDVHQVMLALNEASNAMGLTLQVRSHALKAYQDLMQISL